MSSDGDVEEKGDGFDGWVAVAVGAARGRCAAEGEGDKGWRGRPEEKREMEHGE